MKLATFIPHDYVMCSFCGCIEKYNYIKKCECGGSIADRIYITNSELRKRKINKIKGLI